MQQLPFMPREGEVPLVLYRLVMKDSLQSISRFRAASCLSLRDQRLIRLSPLRYNFQCRRNVQVSDPSHCGNRSSKGKQDFCIHKPFISPRFFCWSVTSHTHSQNKSPTVLVLCSGGQISLTSFHLNQAKRHLFPAQLTLFSSKHPLGLQTEVLTFLDIAVTT